MDTCEGAASLFFDEKAFIAYHAPTLMICLCTPRYVLTEVKGAEEETSHWAAD